MQNRGFPCSLTPLRKMGAPISTFPTWEHGYECEMNDLFRVKSYVKSTAHRSKSSKDFYNMLTKDEHDWEMVLNCCSHGVLNDREKAGTTTIS